MKKTRRTTEQKIRILRETESSPSHMYAAQPPKRTGGGYIIKQPCR